MNFDAVVSIEISDEEIERRMTGRRTCIKCGAIYHVVAAPPSREGICDKCGSVLEQRKDDKPETVKARLVTYHQETEPQGLLCQARGAEESIQNQPTIEATNAVIMEVLKRLRGNCLSFTPIKDRPDAQSGAADSDGRVPTRAR